MNRTVIAYLIGFIFLLLASVLLVGTLGGGLDQALVARAEAAINKHEEAERSIARTRGQVEGWVQEFPQLFEQLELAAQWRESFDTLDKKLKLAGTDVPKLQALLSENDPDKKSDVEMLVEQVSSASLSAQQAAVAIAAEARPLVEFKRSSAESLAGMERDMQATQAFDFSLIQSQVDQAVADWPTKKPDLDQRVEALESLQQNSQQLWQSTAEARGRVARDQFNGSDVAAIVQASRRLSESSAALKAAPENLERLIGQLYWSWDKVLADMEIIEGSTVSFRQKLQVTKVRALPTQAADPAPGASDADKSSTGPAETKVLPPEYVNVTKEKYESMKSLLGMVIQHKPAGKYDSEAVGTQQPPGYAYVASPDQQRNRYGYWSHRGGSSFWTFYGQYRFFGDLMGGSRYGRVTPTMYNDYQRQRRVGTPYFGTSQQGQKLYGSDGAVTKTKYASSRYVATGGFKNSQYARSGGTYRGSAYSRSTSSSRSSSSARSSSRSSGFRSSGRSGGK